MKKSKPIGWRNHPMEHALARRGISTKSPVTTWRTPHHEWVEEKRIENGVTNIQVFKLHGKHFWQYKGVPESLAVYQESNGGYDLKIILHFPVPRSMSSADLKKIGEEVLKSKKISGAKIKLVDYNGYLGEFTEDRNLHISVEKSGKGKLSDRQIKNILNKTEQLMDDYYRRVL